MSGEMVRYLSQLFRMTSVCVDIHFCDLGLIEDIYLKGRSYNAALIKRQGEL